MSAPGRLPLTQKHDVYTGAQDDLNAATILPPSMAIIPRLLALTRDVDLENEEILRLIRVDSALTTAVMRVCNSATFGGAVQTETLAGAVNRLGIREIYRITLQVVAAPAFKRGQEAGYEMCILWEHSLLCAVAAQVLAARTRVD